MNVLVLCTGNACRSQMAEGYLKHFLGEEHQVFSAGVEVHGLNQSAIKVMGEDGIDISKHTSDHIDKYKDFNMDYVLTVCDSYKENCPYFPAKVKITHHSFTDPGIATGTEDEILDEFRRVRDEIKGFCQKWAELIN